MQFNYRSVLAASWLAMVVLPPAMALPAQTIGAAPAGDSLKRPRICLVLSGGGARGAAHVGVIKVLEEYRVPIHCIAGTSMGALVGASYATGTSITEMEKILQEISTELLFKENPPRQELAMRRKQDDYSILFTPEVGLRGGEVKLGKGLVTGVQLETVLRRLSKAKGHHRFDDLPIPYRAVATDLVTGKAVVFSEGELANVMRASMSVPGAVAPAEFRGMILVDGMLTSNLPIQTTRDQMGADIIIAVNVGTPLLKREDLNGIFGVTGQMLSILTEQNVQASLATLQPNDILISPELGDFSTSDFDDLEQIAPLGEVAARKVADRLAQLSLPAGEYVALRQRQQVIVAADLRPVDEVRFVNLQRVNPQTAQAAMDTKPGQPIDQPTLDRDMRRLYGTGDFEHVNYRFLEEPGKRILAVDAVEKSWGPDYLRFGLGLSSDFSGDAFFNLLGSYRKTWLNSLGAEWRTDVQLGHTSGLYSEFYQPFTAQGPLFIAPYAAIERRTADLYQDDDRIASYETTSTLAGVDLGSQFRRYGELRFGLLGGKLKPQLDTGPQSLSPGEGSITQGAFTSRLILDQLDSVHFPRSGWLAGMHLFNANSALGADDEYTKWDAEANAVYSFDNHTFNFAIKAGGKLGNDPLPRYNQFQWGGFLQQSGYSTGQLLGEELQYGRLMYYHRIMRGSMFEGAYSGFSLEAGRIGNPLVPGNSEDWLKSASVFIAADSPLGPVYLGYGRAQDGNSSFYFYLGRPF
ncbi:MULTISPECIES: patatin-like phospholipase family protein [unclassified Pseudomonas]|uniref:patatin-like phospholipase family protein n=1 Tax=unclassified Pseudomonas TaxID=196821 RepID=UPI001EDD239E|nr:patatin-like phospholipase family protein [Pseudomonas sp. MMS21 TM103]MCG4454209.1 patatin-like phospholipase family protein [Pseudomonas sp. MMS21 TM103]